MPQGDKGNFDSFLQKVREGTPGEVEGTLDLDGDGEQEATERSYRQKLSDALEEGDAYKVWKLLLNEEFKNIPHLKDLNEVSKSVADREEVKDWLYRFISYEFKNLLENNGKEDLPSEEDRLNLDIQSNPLCLSLEWLWRNNSKVSQSPQHEESEKGSIIEAALDNAFLLEKMASYKNHFSHDKYMDRAEKCEKFAIDIVEQVNDDKELLHKVMDIDGEGALVKVSLLKMAADKERKMVSGRSISLINKGVNKVVWYYQLLVSEIDFSQALICTHIGQITKICLVFC